MNAINQASGKNWHIYNGDCIEVMRGLPYNSVHYSIFSPPFASLYTYSNSDRDLGNCKGTPEFFDHFKYCMAELFRILKPGRLISMHCIDMPTSKVRHGYIGLDDFPGDLIRCGQAEGFIYHSRVCIWKDPVTAMQRTKAIGLLHKQIKKDSALSRQGIADYVVTLRKPGENDEPIAHTNETFPVGVWQKYASPVWMDIDPSDTLQYRAARDANDERHIAPLQLGVIRRCIELWSNPKDVVFTPFLGIGSEVYSAVEMGRYGVGVELKPSYFAQAEKNISQAQESSRDLFIA